MGHPEACRHCIRIVNEMLESPYLIPSTSSFNTALHALALSAKQGDNKACTVALSLFEKMKQISSSTKQTKMPCQSAPDETTYGTVLQALSSRVYRGEEIAGQVAVTVLNELRLRSRPGEIDFFAVPRSPLNSLAINLVMIFYAHKINCGDMEACNEVLKLFGEIQAQKSPQKSCNSQRRINKKDFEKSTEKMETHSGLCAVLTSSIPPLNAAPVESKVVYNTALLALSVKLRRCRTSQDAQTGQYHLGLGLGLGLVTSQDAQTVQY